LAVDFPRYYRDYQYPHEEPTGGPPRFYESNGQYGGFDSRVLFVLLRKLRPKRMIEIGSGFSSLLTADVNRRFLGGALEFTCIEPYPRKTGSDVNYLYFEVLPRLAPGVVIHIHDIFLPQDYPKQWILEGRSWNEQYIVRALLIHSKGFEVLFSTRYANLVMRDRLSKALGGKDVEGHSLWLVRTGNRILGSSRRFLGRMKRQFMSPWTSLRSGV
jgi:hypothetical protein